METVQTKNCVLNEDAIKRKIRRMALEVAERNYEEKELILAGIAGNGEVVAQSLMDELKQLTKLELVKIKVALNKKDPLEVAFDPQINPDNRVIILVDDVANTGRTMLYALKPLLNARPKKLQTLVLVERSHKLFPIQTDYAGLSITTTLQEHIAVETEGGRLVGAWLY